MAQRQDVDIDRIVDYKAEYSSYIKQYKITGDHLIGKCPFHDDREASFSADLITGKWICFAEDRGGNFITFYAEINGLDTKEAYRLTGNPQRNHRGLNRIPWKNMLSRSGFRLSF